MDSWTLVYFLLSGFHISTESALIALELLSGLGLDIRARGGRKEFLRADLLHDLPVLEANVEHSGLVLSH